MERYHPLFNNYTLKSGICQDNNQSDCKFFTSGGHTPAGETADWYGGTCIARRYPYNYPGIRT